MKLYLTEARFSCKDIHSSFFSQFFNRMRVCSLLRIVGRFSCFALQNAWCAEFQETLEALVEDDDRKVREVGKKSCFLSKIAQIHEKRHKQKINTL